LIRLILLLQSLLGRRHLCPKPLRNAD